MVRIAILSDTHIPSRARAMPDWVEDELRAADHVIHAGDFDSQAILDRVTELADDHLTAVAGNMDSGSLGLPEVATVDLGGRTVVVSHGTGSPRGYLERVRRTVESETEVEAPIAVSGHTHEVVDETVDGSRILNPGSATGASPATEPTMLRATVEDGSVSVEVLRS